MLGIDFQQILLHLLNFVILFAIAYFLLYKPVKKFMDDRSAHYKEMDDEANENLKASENAKAEYEGKLASVSDELREIRAKAQREASKTAETVVANAKTEADKIISEAKIKAENERRRIINDANEEVVKLAGEATDRLIEQKTSQTFDDFLNTVERNGKNEEE